MAVFRNISDTSAPSKKRAARATANCIIKTKSGSAENPARRAATCRQLSSHRLKICQCLYPAPANASCATPRWLAPSSSWELLVVLGARSLRQRFERSPRRLDPCQSSGRGLWLTSRTCSSKGGFLPVAGRTMIPTMTSSPKGRLFLTTLPRLPDSSRSRSVLSAVRALSTANATSTILHNTTRAPLQLL